MQRARLWLGLWLPVLAGLVCGSACPLAAAEKADDEAVYRDKWIGDEIEFVEILGAYGYEDLAKQLIEMDKQVQPPLSEDQVNNLNRAEVKLTMQLVKRIENTGERLGVAQRAINEMEKIAKSFKPEEVAWVEAQIDLVEIICNLGSILAADLERQFILDPEKEKVLRTDFRAFLNANAKVWPLKQAMDKAGGPDKAPNEKKAFEAAQAEANAARGKVVLLATTEWYYTRIFRESTALRQTIDNHFNDAMGLVEEGRGAERTKAMAEAETWFRRKIKLQHLLEAAFADRAVMYERGSKEREKVLKEAAEFYDGNLLDYQEYFPADKQVYLNWFQVLGRMDDPIFEKPERYDSEIPETENDYHRFFWPSDIMEYFLVKSDKGVLADKEGTELQKTQGLFYYAEALLRMVEGGLEDAVREKDDKKRGELVKHAVALLEKARGALDEIKKPKCELVRSRVFTVDSNIRFKAQIELETRYQLIQAARALASGKADAQAKAEEKVQRAFEICGGVMVDSPGFWAGQARAQLDVIKAASSRMLGKVVESVPALFVEAEEAIRTAQSPGLAPAARQELLKKSIDRYFQVIDIVKKSDNRQRRAVYLPKSWSYLGTAALQLEDYYTAYIANFEVVQEFSPRFYPRDRYPQVDVHFQRAMNNLRVAAAREMKLTDSDFDRELYVDSLLILQSSSDNLDPDMLVSLINELKKLKLYKQAVEYIDQVPADHIYHRIVLLMGADIYQTMMKNAQKEFDQLAAEKTPDAEMKERLAELPGLIKTYQEKAEDNAKRFMAEVKARPAADPADKKQAEVYVQETSNLPNAMLIPIANALTAKAYDKVAPLCQEFVTAVGGIKEITPAARQDYLAQGYWMMLVAETKKVDEKNDPGEKVAAALKSAGEVQPKLKEVDKDEKYVSQSCMLLGASWNNLANRMLREQAAIKDQAKREALGKTIEGYSLQAANWFRNAQSVIYKQFAIGLHIGRIYSEQNLNKDAEAVYDKVIKYWAESQFAEGALYRTGKSLADLKAAKPQPDAAAVLGGAVDAGSFKGAANDEALVAALNEFVTGGKLKADPEALKALAGKFGGDERLKANLLQAAVIAGNSAPSQEESQKLRRTLLEALFPEVLAAAPPMQILPTADEFDAAAREVGKPYITDEGLRKAAVLKSMHDRRLVTSAGDKEVYVAYLKQLEDSGQADNAKLLESDLRTYVFGILNAKTNRIEKRSYPQAGRVIDMIFDYDRQVVTRDNVQLPTKKFLEDIQGALEFQANIIQAKKRYARAMVEMGKFEKALEYLEALVRFYPNDPNLLLDQAEACTAIGTKLSEGGKYAQAAAERFMQARLLATEVITKSGQYSPLQWAGYQTAYANEAAEVIARKAAGEAGAKGFDVAVEVFDRESGQRKKVDAKAQVLGDQAKRVTSDLTRMQRLRPPEEWVTEAKRLLAELAKVGFVPETYKPEAAPAAGAK